MSVNISPSPNQKNLKQRQDQNPLRMVMQKQYQLQRWVRQPQLLRPLRRRRKIRNLKSSR
jgi:hypothetical protein